MLPFPPLTRLTVWPADSTSMQALGEAIGSGAGCAIRCVGVASGSGAREPRAPLDGSCRLKPLPS
jgi:hypothetical protein